MKNVSLAVIICAIGIIFSPIQKEYKIITSLTGLGVSANLSLEELKKRRTKVETEKQIKNELNLKALQIENDVARLEDDLEVITLIRSNTETELAILKEKQILEIVSLEEQTKQHLNDEREKLKYTLKLEKDKQQQLINQVWFSVCNELADMSMSALNELVSYEQFIEDENQRLRQELTKNFRGLRSRFYAKKDRNHNALMGQYEMSLDDAATTIQNLAATVLESASNFELKQFEKTDTQTDEVNQGYLDIVKADIDSINESFKKGFEGNYSGFISDYSSFVDELGGLREELEYLRGKLNQQLKPGLIKKPRHDGDRKTNDFLNWLFSNWQILAEHNSSLMRGDRTLEINFDLIEDQDKLTKKISRLKSKELPAQLQAYFGAETEPTIGLNVEIGCWTAVIPPTRGGFIPELNDSRFAAVALPKPASYQSLEDELKERIETKQNFEQIEQMMMDFKPIVPLPMPKTVEPTNLELNTFRWFFLWRNQATKLENIVTVKGLAREIYGLNDIDALMPDLGETMRSRIERLQVQLRIEMVDLNN